MSSIAERDADRIAAFEQALDNIPTPEDIERLANEAADARRLADDAETERRRAIVRVACVYGWTETAATYDVLPRTLHAWHRDIAPDIDDLSTVPTVERPREAKRVEAARAQADAAREALARAEAFVQAREERDRAIAERLDPNRFAHHETAEHSEDHA